MNEHVKKSASSVDYGGIVTRIVAGQYTPPNRKTVHIPIREIAIRPSLNGAEADLYAAMHGNSRPCLVGDEITMDILGRRVEKQLRSTGTIDSIVLKSPRSNMETVERLRHDTRHAEVLVAVGSGTINDLVKYASFLDGKPYSVFPTSPMNAYTTGTASISDGGVKQSLPAHSATGVFFDLSILAACPDRLIANAFADVVCRTTAQVDWLLSRQILGTFYDELSYILLAVEEAPLFHAAALLPGRDFDALAALVRTCILNGLSTSLIGTTHAGSMAEHMISHYLDMFTGDAHPGTLHGEQVGVTTISVLTLQNRILKSNTPPVLAPIPAKAEYLQKKFGNVIGNNFAAGVAKKTLSEADTESLNKRLHDDWNSFAEPLRQVMLAVDDIKAPMKACGALLTASELGFSADMYRDAVLNARYIRDRYTILDFAEAASILHDSATTEMAE